VTFEVIDDGPLPVYSWAPDLEPGARAQARNCARLPVSFHHVAVMADGHQGYGVPIGAVLALDDALSPYAVGNDIGCGMAIVPTTLSVSDLLAPVATRSGDVGAIARDDIMGWVQSTIPSGNSAHRHPARLPDVDTLLHTAYDAMLAAADSTDELRDDRDHFLQRGRAQLGTLGSGNHFIELLAGPDDDVWVMVHSGSRGVGGAICDTFHRLALAHCDAEGQALPDPGLAWLPASSPAGRCYERALRAGLDYAEFNRRHMLEQIATIVERRFGDAIRWDKIVDIHHNDATLETHFDRRVWVHRKGAVKASAGTPTITPGSMGTGTFLGTGLGNPASFASCSHGAGRVRSRAAARRELSLQRELETVAAAGGKVFAASKDAVLDEMPGAYKDLDDVMSNQADLVRPTRRFRPLGTYKGADARRGGRRAGARRWRPEEER
jgi:tRNA-splicing ligase RtcB (3'-phosphate/5'-hydroxy nucleic acid ligase)